MCAQNTNAIRMSEQVTMISQVNAEDKTIPHSHFIILNNFSGMSSSKMHQMDRKSHNRTNLNFGRFWVELNQSSCCIIIL